MKKYISFFVSLILFYGCNVRNQDRIADDSKMDSLTRARTENERKLAMEKTTTVKMIDSNFVFGTITEGEKVAFSFRFTNTGSNPLVIFDATASCGCTVPEKPKEPIKPGEMGFIKVVFNSAGKRDHVTKDVTVTSNADPSFPTLKLEGDINPKK
jgi:hypothetical protein